MKKQFNTNEIIALETGKKARILGLLGQGGQGTVYSVDVEGQQYALKWYNSAPSAVFYQNLCNNVREGSPSSLFLWPLAVTRRKFNSFGYIMPLKPEGYHEFSDFRLAKVRFTSMRAVLNAAIQTCEAFRLLHAKGLSYQDLNDGGFFIHPKTGQVLICDCDNVFPHGEQSGVLGKARYIAPEVVKGDTMPNSYSDRFSMTVMLFMYFCIDHPLEGKRVVSFPCLTEDIERKLFGEHPCFIYDPKDQGNAPVRGVHHNALTLWPMLPKVLRDAFIEELGQYKITHPSERMTEMQWLDVLVHVRDSLVRCPVCGDEAFADSQQLCINPRCNAGFQVTNWLTSDQRHIPLLDGSLLYFSNAIRPEARVVSKPNAEDILLVQNLTESVWQLITPTGRSLSIDPKGFFPIKSGMTLSFVCEGLPQSYQITNNY